MKLTCPNCGAQYAVDDRVIPAAGREVQCSGCRHTWFQPPASGEEGTGKQEAADRSGESGVPAQRRPVDPAVLAILREEAEREQAARRAEAQTFVAVDDPAEEKAPAPDLAVAPGPSPDTKVETLPEPVPVEPAPVAADDPPDAPMPATAQPNSPSEPRNEEPVEAPAPGDATQDGHAGFRTGLTLAIGFFSLLTLLYAGARPIGEAVPTLAAPLERYVAAVDFGRAWLDGLVRDSGDS